MGKLEKLPNKNLAISKDISSGGYPSTVHGLRFIHWISFAHTEQLLKYKNSLNNKKDPYIVLDLNDYKEFFGIKSKDNKPIWESIFEATGRRIEQEKEGASKYSSIFTELVMPYSMSKSLELTLSKRNKSFIKDACIEHGYPYSASSFLIKLHPDNGLLEEFISPKVFTVVSPKAYENSKTVNQVQFYLKCAAHVNLKNGFGWDYFDMIRDLSHGFRAKNETERMDIIRKYKESLSEFKKKILRPLVSHVNDNTDLTILLEERKYEAIFKVRRALDISPEKTDFKRKYYPILKELEVNPASLLKKIDPVAKPFINKILPEAVNQIKDKLVNHNGIWLHKGSKQEIPNIGAYSAKAINNQLINVLNERAIAYDYKDYLDDIHLYPITLSESQFYIIKNEFLNKVMQLKGQLPSDLFEHIIRHSFSEQKIFSSNEEQKA